MLGRAAVSFLEFIQGSGAKGNAAASPGKLPTGVDITPAGVLCPNEYPVGVTPDNSMNQKFEPNLMIQGFLGRFANQHVGKL